MEQLSIYGGKPLRGIVTVSGSKNAALPILFATLLTDGETLLENLPDIADVRLALQILAEMGCRTERRGAGIAICTEGAQYRMPAPEAVGLMRASTYLLGGCLGRFGMCELPRPGGCNFGTRPIDLHCRALSALGAQFSTEGNCLVGKASGMHGAEICFPTCSVGATVNTLLAAVCAAGETRIRGAAMEPHVVDLARYLNACGAQIEGAGTDEIRVVGGRPLHGCRHRIIGDMIEAGTYLMAGLATRGEVSVRGVSVAELTAVLQTLVRMGGVVSVSGDCVRCRSSGPLQNVAVRTAPYPGFPTDLHPQLCALMATGYGLGRITETVFPTRFRYTEELRRMGAQLYVGDGEVLIWGGNLRPAPITVPDLRAGAALLIAALSAPGETVLSDCGFLYRGYTDLAPKLWSLGASVMPTTPGTQAAAQPSDGAE